MFSLRDLEIKQNEAAKYRQMMDISKLLELYKDVVYLYENKLTIRYNLKCLVQKAKEAHEAEQKQEKLATNGVDFKQTEVISTTDLTVAESMDIMEKS
jgi:hypothetical protein